MVCGQPLRLKSGKRLATIFFMKKNQIMLDFYVHLVGWGLGLQRIQFLSHISPFFVKFYLLIKQLFCCLFFRRNHNGVCFYRKY